MRFRGFGALAAIGMMGTMAYGLGTKFTWGGDCDCFCWMNNECWSWIGDPAYQYPSNSSEDVLIPVPGSLPAAAYTILLNELEEPPGTIGNVKDLEIDWSTTFTSVSGETFGGITASTIELRATASDITITVKDNVHNHVVQTSLF